MREATILRGAGNVDASESAAQPFSAEPEQHSFALDSRAGRLIEISIAGSLGAADVVALDGHLLREASNKSARFVIFADYRHAKPFTQPIASAWTRCMRAFNEHVACSAILLDRANETFNLRFERVVRCACNPSRRIFYEVHELRDWLALGSTGAELTRLDELILGTSS
jgi:hypothetical protein